MSELPTGPEVHPMCAEMHRHGYCVCTMVECICCDRVHPPHKPCGLLARELVPLPKEEPKR